MLTVHLRINDAATKQPTPVRLSVTGPNAAYFPPLGRPAVFTVGRGEDVGGNLHVGRENFAIVDGTCEIELPAGMPLRVRATKGIEYRPLDETVTLGPGQMAIRLPIERWTDTAARGWMSGDSRAHCVPPHAALLEAAAEDVDLANVLARVELQLMKDGNTYPTLPNLLAFSGQSPALQSGRHAVVVNTFNTHRALGSLGLLHAHRVVHPLAFGDPFDTDDWSLLDWSAQCRRKKGLVVWAKAFHPESGLLGGEALVAAILGKIDAVEFDAEARSTPLLPWYYRLLNAGIRLSLVAGSGKESNRLPIGAMRTYAHIGEQPRGYTAWIEAVRAGNTFITNGPLLNFQANEKLTARAECVTRFEKLELVADGRPFAVAKPAEESNRFAASLEADIPANANWVAARCVGGYSVLNGAAVNFAHTSPVYLAPPRRDAEAVAVFRDCIERIREWANAVAHYREEKWKKKLLGSCDEAVAKLVPDSVG